MRFEGKVAVVTGAGRGIGLACAAELLEGGAYVVVMDVAEAALAEADARLKAIGSAYELMVCDVSDEDKVKELLKGVEEKQGHIDILINNAGIYREGRDRFVNQKSDVWKKRIDVNIYGTLYPTHAVLPGMIERKYGRIVNLASVAGVYGLRNMVDYSLTKGAVIAFTAALAKEVGPHNITVNAISPGNISVDGTDRSGMSFLERSGTPEECAHAICFLASDDASFISGQNYQVDGSRKTM